MASVQTRSGMSLLASSAVLEACGLRPGQHVDDKTVGTIIFLNAAELSVKIHANNAEHPEAAVDCTLLDAALDRVCGITT